jgi:hypothetical protein
MNTPVKPAAPCPCITYFERLGPKLTHERLEAIFTALIQHQDEPPERDALLSPIPLAWVALAEWVGLTVDLPTGRIADGPRALVRGLL